ncbi:MAG: HD domain-containing protein [Candidatus Hydrothermales bacterium]
MGKKVITLKVLLKEKRVLRYIEEADRYMEKLGYTEHGLRHSKYVGETAGKILRELKYPERKAELAEIAGFLHDIGNVIHREHHAQFGALIAHQLLTELGMPIDEVIEVAQAIGNHHEEDGIPTGALTSALIIADKSDVHRERVRKEKFDIKTDIHDRVNYSAKKSNVIVFPEKKVIRFDIEIDTKISPVMEYFEIFLQRMIVASMAAKNLGQKFELFINNTKML